MAIYQCDPCGFGVRLRACRVVMALLACGAWVLAVCGAMLALAGSASAANTIYWSTYTSKVAASNLDASGTPSTFASVTNQSTGLAFDTSGNLYVGDNAGGPPHQETIDRVTPAGTVSAFVSSGLDEPSGVVLDAAGNLYIADYSNIDKAGPSGGAASGFGGSTQNGQGLAIDAAGNLYVADEGNNRILKIPPGGGPGSPFATGLNEPTGLAFDAAGNLYVANYGNGDITKIPPGGGPGSTFATGLHQPRGIAFDAAGNLYVVNYGTSDITKIPPGGGTGSTLVSTGSPADFLAIAEAPLGTGVPAISGAGTVGQPLTCGAATWAADPPGGQLFEQPTSNAVAWQLNGAAVPGASGSSFTPTQAGSYTCSRTGSNQAGSTSQRSPAVQVSAAPGTGAHPSNQFTTSEKVSKTGVITIDVRTQAPGAVSGVATFVEKIKRTKGRGRHRRTRTTHRTVTYGTATVRTGTATITVLTITPKAAARTLLKQLKRLELTITVSFTPTGGTVNKHVLRLAVTAPRPPVGRRKR